VQQCGKEWEGAIGSRKKWEGEVGNGSEKE